MGEDDDARMVLTKLAHLLRREALMHFAMPLPGEHLNIRLGGDVLARYSSGNMMTRLTPESLDDRLALPEVQQMSDSAFTAAEVLT